MNALYFVFLSLGLVYLRSAYEKISSGTFVANLGGTLQKMASNDPYPLYKSFLLNVAIPNSTVFGLLTMWGELLVGLALTVVSLYLVLTGTLSSLLLLILAVAFAGGLLLNLNFWLAAGWTGVSTDDINLLMLALELIGLVWALNRLRTS